MKTILLLIVLASAGAVGGEQPADGIYLHGDGALAPAIQSQDGQKAVLGARQDLKIRKSELYSQDNANTRFYLSVTVPYDKAIGPTTYLLLVRGTAYRQTGSGTSGQETSSLSFYISGADKAKEVSEFLAVPVHYRRHPQHTFLVSLTPTEESSAPGEEVTATLHIRNVGNNIVAFMKGGRNRAARDNQYVFCARLGGKQVEDIGTSYHHGGLAAKRILKPGDVFEDTISLSKWFAFREPGMYEVHGSYYLDFKDPSTDSWGTLWEDYVSADFIVTIKKLDETSNKKAEAGKLQGAAHARKDIQAGELRILYCGKPWSVDKPLVDEATGYRVQIVGDCSVTEVFAAEVEAYNQAMRDWHAKTKKAEPLPKR
jgi:hypothetical protein